MNDLDFSMADEFDLTMVEEMDFVNEFFSQGCEIISPARLASLYELRDVTRYLTDNYSQLDVTL